MWSCCAVEREASKTTSPQSRSDPSKRKLADRGSLSGGNGRNIGLGLVARQGQLSERPLAADNGAEVPHAHAVFEMGGWTVGVSSDNTIGKLSTTASSNPGGGCAQGGLLNPTTPKQPNHSPFEMDDQGNGVSADGNVLQREGFCSKRSSQFRSNGSASSKMFRSRSSRLLMEDGVDEDLLEGGGTAEVHESRSPLQRRQSMQVVMEHNHSSEVTGQGLCQIAEEDAVESNSQKRRTQIIASMTSSVKSRLFNGKGDSDKTGTSSSSTALGKDLLALPNAKSGVHRRNSQFAYAESGQTAIVFDWDDTLFPTSYLIDDLRLNHKKTLKEQKLPRDLYDEVAVSLKELEISVLELLRLANRRGRVILVTLARAPWVEDSCRSFYNLVGDLIKELGIKVVYAQQGVAVDYDKRRMMSDEDVERFYAEMKGKAISREVEAFYSQYEGQSWKNIISIGDSDFERLGTMMMAQEYMKSRGLLKVAGDKGFEVASNEAFGRNTTTIDLNGHIYKVRTKTFKMLDCPTIGELKEEIALLHRWLPKMVELDDGFDADLSALDDPSLAAQIETVLSGKKPGKKGK